MANEPSTIKIQATMAPLIKATTLKTKRRSSDCDRRRRRRTSSRSTGKTRARSASVDLPIKKGDEFSSLQDTEDDPGHLSDNSNTSDDNNDDLLLSPLHASPISVADVREFAGTSTPRKKVTFAQEPPRQHLYTPSTVGNGNGNGKPPLAPVLKSSSVNQRLQGLTLAELDCGLSVPRSAFQHASDSLDVSSSSSSSSTRAQLLKQRVRRKPVRPIPVLEQRLERVKRLLEEAKAEFAQHAAELNSVFAENKFFRKKLKHNKEFALEEVLQDLAYKRRKYEKKISSLSKAKDANEKECYAMVRKMLEEQSLREQLSTAQVSILENIDAANRREQKVRRRSTSSKIKTKKKKSKRSKSSPPRTSYARKDKP